MEYSSWEKKKYLTMLIGDIDPTDEELQQIVMLLESDFEYKDETLLHIYDTFSTLLQQSYQTQQEKLENTVKIVHDQLEQEAEQSSKEADDLLLDL